MARLLFLLLLTAAQGKRKGVNVKKKEKVELDDARLPPLHEVLAELDLDVDELLARGVETTRQLCAWGRSDISIHGNDLGWDRDKQKVINEKINAIRADAAVQKTTETVDPLKAARDERNALTYGRVFADRATASFEFKKAWFGADFPEALSMPRYELYLWTAVRNYCGRTRPSTKAVRCSRTEEAAPSSRRPGRLIMLGPSYSWSSTPQIGPSTALLLVMQLMPNLRRLLMI